MYIFGDRLDKTAVRIYGYDPIIDSEWELCAIFLILPSENRVELVTRHRRRHMNVKDCELLAEFSPEELAIFDREMPRFEAEAMRLAGLRAIKVLPNVKQENLPIQNTRQLQDPHI